MYAYFPNILANLHRFTAGPNSMSGTTTSLPPLNLSNRPMYEPPILPAGQLR